VVVDKSFRFLGTRVAKKVGSAEVGIVAGIVAVVMTGIVVVGKVCFGVEVVAASAGTAEFASIDTVDIEEPDVAVEVDETVEIDFVGTPAEAETADGPSHTASVPAMQRTGWWATWTTGFVQVAPQTDYWEIMADAADRHHLEEQEPYSHAAEAEKASLVEHSFAANSGIQIGWVRLLSALVVTAAVYSEIPVNGTDLVVQSCLSARMDSIYSSLGTVESAAMVAVVLYNLAKSKNMDSKV
jgi:hypothetical protein